MWTDADMFEAWKAGFRWCADRVEVFWDGDELDELFIPNDKPGVLGFDHAEACGDWLNDYEAERS